MKKYIHTYLSHFTFFVLIVLLPPKGICQTVELIPEPGFFEYATYYISGFDVQTGASDIQLCRYRLHIDQSTPIVKVVFQSSMVSPQMGISTPVTIVDVEADILNPQADVVFDNRNISLDTQMLYDVNGNAVILQPKINEIINAAAFNEVLNTVLSSGRLPDGEYSFSISVYSGSDPSSLTLAGQDSKTIIVRTPTTLSLESPGGIPADINSTQIYTIFPIFNWNAQTCMTCENYIRVAEYNPEIHSSTEEAIDDNLSLPFNQVTGWESVGTFTSFQYPVSGARQLEFGLIYVWQVKQSLLTTEGEEEILSPVWAFKIADLNQEPEQDEVINTLLLTLRNVIGEDQYATLFGPNGELNGFLPSGYFTNDDITIDEAGVSYILNGILTGSLEITNIQVGE